MSEELAASVDNLEMNLMRLTARKEIVEVEEYLANIGFTEEKGRLDRSPKKNWVEKLGGLPDYIDRIAKHLHNKGMSISHAIASAINAAKKMCATGDLNWPGLQSVNPGSRAQACAAVARWEAMKAAARSKKG